MDTNNIQKQKEIINGQFLIREKFKKQYKLIALIVGLIILHIFAGLVSQRQFSRLSNLKKELTNIQYQQLTIQSSLNNITSQSQVAKELKLRGSELKENLTPVIRIQ